jgi:undecaprenyl-diphosphatase
MVSFIQILVLALIQGAAELLPVSSSAHVIVAEKLMGLDPSSPDMTMLLVLLHTGTMFAVITYFWKDWHRNYFSSPGRLRWFAILLLIATVCTGIIGLGLKVVIEKVFLHGAEHAEVEALFSNLPLISGSLAAVGVLIIIAGLREEKIPSQSEIEPSHAIWIGIVQGLCLPFRGFSRSGSTISTGLLMGLPKEALEEFSFALAVILTPPIILQEAHRLFKEQLPGSHVSVGHLLAPGLVGMVFSFLAGLLALKLLSRWLQAGRWKFFGIYCLIASVVVLAIHFNISG